MKAMPPIPALAASVVPTTEGVLGTSSAMVWQSGSQRPKVVDEVVLILGKLQSFLRFGSEGMLKGTKQSSRAGDA